MQETFMKKTHMKQTYYIQQGKRDYQVIAEIGRGAQGVVYRVRRPGDNRDMACKRVGNKQVWKREAWALQEAGYSAFPQYYDGWWQEGQYGGTFLRSGSESYGSILMEYVEGQNLEDYIKVRNKLPIGQIFTIAVEVAQALAYLQQKNPPMILRDLKPANIRISSEGKVKIVDLGSVCLADERKSVLTGTPGYTAPEQLQGEGQVGTYSDVYAYGQLLLYLLSHSKGTKRKKMQSLCLKSKLKRVAVGCIQDDYKKRIPDMRVVLHKIKKRGKISRRVYCDKNICIYNLR